MLPQLAYFYRYLKHRLVFLLVITILVGFLDGLGLTMFLPLLQLLSDDTTVATSEQMGNMRFIMDGLAAVGLPFTLAVVLLTILFFFTLKGVAKWFASYLNVVYQQYFIRKLRVENINALSDYSYRYFVTADAGAIQNAMSGEVGKVVQSYRNYSLILQNMVMVLTYTALAFLANAQFATLVAVGGVLSNLVFNKMYKTTKELSKSLVITSNGFQRLLIQQVAFFKYLKATGQIKAYADNLKEKVYEVERSVRKMGIIDSIMTGVREPLMILVVVLVIFAQVYILGGPLSTIVLSILFFYRALTAVMQLQSFYNRFLSFSGSLANMEVFIDDLKAHRDRFGKDRIPGLQEKIVLNNVSFGYLEGDDILKDINLTIHRNETVAFVGESGSGKTTLMNIVSGILAPTAGSISIDGQEYRDIDITHFQQRIGYITQEPVIFDDTVFNNVTFWDEQNDKNIARFWWAIKKASIADIFNDSLDPLTNRLGANGVSLSGGQKQRLSIARELYKRTDLLLMDEATSALDSETERSIQLNIDEMKGQAAIIIIAHRLSTIKNADRVIYLKKGRVEFVGTYQQLITESDAFQRMVKLQEL